MPSVEIVAHNVTINYGGDNAEVLRAISLLEEHMSALSDAVAAANARVAEDFANLRALLDQALATDVADAAKIAELTAQADALTADAAEAVTALGALDPDPSFPAAPVEPPA